jgi:hypothetical protein
MAQVRPLAVALMLAASFGPVPAPAAPAATRLVIVGGGERPPEAVARFVQWSGGVQARLLVITWASAEPKGEL